MNSKVFQLMQEHLGKLDNVEKPIEKPDGNITTYTPFFSSLYLQKKENYQIEILNGSVLNFKGPDKISPYLGRIELRMGHPEKGGSVSYKHFTLSQDLKKTHSRGELEQASTNAFWESAKDLENKISSTLGKPKEDTKEDFVYFSREEPRTYFQEEVSLDKGNLEDFAKNMKRLSYDLKKHKGIEDVDISLGASKEKKYFMNSEGSKIFLNDKLYAFYLGLISKDERNKLIPHFFTFYSKQIPSVNNMRNKAYQTLEELEEIMKAPVESGGTFPTILDSGNTGFLFHEVVGHSLEAHRIKENEEEESNVFRDKVGERIAPEFVNLWDNPKLKSFQGQSLNGYYEFDEEGVEAQNTHLIKGGVLNDYLHSRESAGFFGKKSNGHTRSMRGTDEPTPRMGNLIIKSSSPVESKELTEHLIKECEKQDKPYGIYLQGSNMGWTEVEEGIYATYPSQSFRVFKNGKTQRVRGIRLKGTPHQTLENLDSMDDNHRVVNGFCGASSGIIPVGEIAPNSFSKSQEFNRIPSNEYVKSYNSIFDKKK